MNCSSLPVRPAAMGPLPIKVKFPYVSPVILGEQYYWLTQYLIQSETRAARVYLPGVLIQSEGRAARVYLPGVLIQAVTRAARVDLPGVLIQSETRAARVE